VRAKDDEISGLVGELQAARTRAMELNFRCNEATFSSSEHREERLRLQAEVQALKVSQCEQRES
jgi:hypothetical protein